MSGAEELILPPFLDEKIGPFGSFAPSLLVPYFTYRTILDNPSWVVAATKAIEGNSNRWGLIIARTDNQPVAISYAPFPGIEYAPFFWNSQGTDLLTFGDYGSVISGEIWIQTTSPVRVNLTEIIYTPRRCG